jgi:hypothetical protein
MFFDAVLLYLHAFFKMPTPLSLLLHDSCSPVLPRLGAIILTGHAPCCGSGLVECGVDKLRNDYTHHLVGDELCTYSALEWFLAPAGASDEALDRLMRLHAVLDVVAIKCGVHWDMDIDSHWYWFGSHMAKVHAAVSTWFTARI